MLISLHAKIVSSVKGLTNTGKFRRLKRKKKDGILSTIQWEAAVLALLTFFHFFPLQFAHIYETNKKNMFMNCI